MLTKFLVFARILIGVVFIFSGFVKGIDPWGFDYKLMDYLHAMNLSWLQFLVLPSSFIVPFFEFMIGVGLLSGVMLNSSTIFCLLFMSFFTPLTLYVALQNPVTDCGCFGDALIITNWQTFFKNICLISLAYLLFKYRKKIHFSLPLKLRKVIFSSLILIYAFLVFWSFNHEPVLDFRPYRAGVNIPEDMTIPKGAPSDVYSTNYYYQNLKTQEIKKFNDNNYPWQDSLNWKFIRMDNPVLIKKGYTPPIHDFFIQTDQGENVADFFLQDTGYVFILISPNLEKASLKRQGQINNLAEWTKNQGFKFICLTASKGTALEKYKEAAKPAYDFYFGDEITLKTIIRSNPGLILLKKGTILSKWHYNDIPSVAKMQNQILPQMKKKLISIR